MPGIFGAFTLEEILPSINGDEPVIGKSRRKKRKKKKKKKKTAVNDNDNGNDNHNDNDNDGDSSDDDADDGSYGNANSKINSNAINNDEKRKDKLKSNTPSGASNISTPQELLRERLIESDGYEASQIDKAMEEMWDKGLVYDEYESVVNYLQSGVCGTTSSTASNSAISSVATAAEEGTNDGEFRRKVSTTTKPTNTPNGAPDFERTTGTAADGEEMAAMALMGVTETVDGGIDHNGQKENENDDIRDEKKGEEDENDGESPGPSTNPTPPASMTTKLDMVAGFENLTDAIFALTQWVKQAANDEEIELFCRAEKTSALPLVVCRGISSEIDDNKRFENAVQPALVGLLMAVLNRCGVDTLTDSAEEDIVERMGNTLKQARKVSLLATDERNIDDDTVISDRVSKFIVSQLTKAMDEMKEYDGNKNKNNSNRDGDLGDDNDAAMAALLSERDAARTDAKSASALAKASMDSLFGDSAITSTSNGDTNGRDCSLQSNTSLEIKNIMLHIVDQETKTRLENEKARLEVLQSQLLPKGEHSETVKKLRGSLSSLETKRMGYKAKIAELKAALLELESQDEEAALQIESLATQISEEERKDDSNAKQLEHDISQAKDSVRYGNLVRGLAGIMKTYGKSVEKATAAITGKPIADDVTEEPNDEKNGKSKSAEVVTGASASSTMEDYLSKIRKYFLKEAHCATQLRQRLAVTKSQVAALRSELFQYNSAKGLGAMSATIAQMEKTVAEKERIIRADTHRVAALVDDGGFLYDELLARIEKYRFNTTETNSGDGTKATDTGTNSVVLAPLFPTDLLKGVPEAIRVMGIARDCQELLPFVKEPESPDGALTAEAEKASSGGGPKPLPTVDPLAAAPAPAAPKFSWANPSAKKESAQTEKHSLLDIQREEEELSRL